MCLYFIGQPEDFVPSGCYFRLVGERKDVWRKMSRPPDYIARRWLYRNYGWYVEEVMRRPWWTFENSAKCNEFNPSARLVDGLLCGLLMDECQNMWQRPSCDKPTVYQLIARTVEDHFEITYEQPPGDPCAYFVKQETWNRPKGWQRDDLAYKRNCSWWEDYIEDFDREQDDQNFRSMISAARNGKPS